MAGRVPSRARATGPVLFVAALGLVAACGHPAPSARGAGTGAAVGARSSSAPLPLAATVAGSYQLASGLAAQPLPARITAYVYVTADVLRVGTTATFADARVVADPAAAAVAVRDASDAVALPLDEGRLGEGSDVALDRARAIEAARAAGLRADAADRDVGLHLDGAEPEGHVGTGSWFGFGLGATRLRLVRLDPATVHTVLVVDRGASLAVVAGLVAALPGPVAFAVDGGGGAAGAFSLSWSAGELDADAARVHVDLLSVPRAVFDREGRPVEAGDGSDPLRRARGPGEDVSAAQVRLRAATPAIDALALLEHVAAAGLTDVELDVHADAGAPGTAAGPPSVTLQPLKVTGGLAPDVVRRYLKRNLHHLSYCYERELLSRPGLAGDLTLRFTIGAAGKVTAADATGDLPTVAPCVRDAVRAIELPPPTGAPVEVEGLVTFRPSS